MKSLSLSQFGIRSNFDLALLDIAIEIEPSNILSGFDVALYVEKFKLKPIR